MANFKYVQLTTTGVKLLEDLKAAITFEKYPFNVAAEETEETNTWEVISEELDDTTSKIMELVLGTTATIASTTKEFHVKFTYEGLSAALPEREHSSMTVQVMEGYNEVGGTYTNVGHPVNYEWADEEYKDSTVYTDRDKTKPIHVYMNIMNNRIAMCLAADPVVHYTDYRKSFLYVGATQPFEYNMSTEGNVLITAGAVKAEVTTPSSPEYNFGQHTSFGNNTFQMLATKSGVLFQKHYPAFITQVPTVGKAYVAAGGTGDTGLLLEPQGFNASAWTKKYHLSPIYVVHPYEGYRGQLEYCIAVSKTNILHLDELIVDIPADTPGKTWTQEVYVYFDHNTEQNFMNRSANVRMGIAFLKEVRYA